MRRLYSARVARPLSSANTRPTRLGYSTIAWCPYEDLVAVISGCGAVSVFHADAPGEAALLVGPNRSPARHLLWRHAPEKPIMLVVADASGLITFWLSSDRRVNVWYVADSVDLSSVPIAIGWNAHATALSAIIARGGLAVWLVPDYPTADPSNPHANSSRLKRDHARRPADPKFPNLIRSVKCNKQDLTKLFGGQLRCATVVPGKVDPSSVALVTVSVANPTRLSVWQVSITKGAPPFFDVRRLSDANLRPTDGNCVACTATPPSGMLYAISDCGVISRWHLQTRSATDNAQSRPSSAQHGWSLHASIRIDQATEQAISLGVLPKSTATVPFDPASRGLDATRKRKIYAFEISNDCKSMLTSTSWGLLLWEPEKLKIVRGFQIEQTSQPLQNPRPQSTSPYWALCFCSRDLPAAFFAVNGQGYVSSFSVLPPIVRPDADRNEIVSSVANTLLSTPHSDSWRGTWDIMASIASEGPNAATLVSNYLSSEAFLSNQNGSFPPNKIEMVHSVIRGMLNSEDASAAAATRLLRLAMDAIKKSAPDSVKHNLMVSAKDAKSITSPANISKAVRQILSNSSRVSAPQLSAAPLADWVMVLCAVWLQRCAGILVQHDPNGENMRSQWAAVAAMIAPDEKSMRPGHGIVYNTPLVRALRPASFAALTLLALEDEYGESDSVPRYFRFSRDEANCVVAAFWEVSLLWESVDALSQPMVNGNTPNLMQSGQTAEQMVNTAIVLGKHLNAARVLANASALRIGVAEKALGLYGAAKGAGFITSCLRRHRSASDPDKAGEDFSTRNGFSTRTEWCQHDIVTGRPLPPWAPLRRCIVSGLLAAEITQQKNETMNVNIASPWIARWADESPFGGRWARVPSLDLELYELLPAVHPTIPERPEGDYSMVRGAKPEDVFPAGAQGGHHGRGNPLIPGHPALAPSGVRNPALNEDGAGAGADHSTSNVAGSEVLGANNIGQLPYHGGNGQLLSSFLTPGVGAKDHASPVMSSAPSVETGSTNAKSKKRQGGKGGKGRNKRTPVDNRSTATDQIGDMSMSLAIPGIANSPFGRIPNGAADAVSTDTRSAVTGATSTTGVVENQPNTHRPKRRKKKAAQASQTNQATQAAQPAHVAHNSHPAQVAVSRAAGLTSAVPHLSGNAALNLGATMNQAASHPSPPSRGKTARGPQSRNASEAVAVAHAAALEAAKQQNIPSNQSGPHRVNLPNNLGGVNNAGSNGVGNVFMGGGGIGSAGLMMRGGNADLPVNPNMKGAFPLPVGIGGDNNMVGAVGGNMGMNGNMSNEAGLSDFTNPNVSGMHGQTGVNMNVMSQQLGLGNASFPGQGTAGQSFAALAEEIGLPSSRFDGLPPEQTQLSIDAIEALSRKAMLEMAAQNGAVTSAGMLDGSLMNSTNPMATSAVNGMNGVGSGPTRIPDAMMPGMSEGIGSSGVGRPNMGGLIPGRNNAIGGRNVRTSAGESVNSAQARMVGTSMDGFGIGGMSSGLMPGGDREGQIAPVEMDGGSGGVGGGMINGGARNNGIANDGNVGIRMATGVNGLEGSTASSGMHGGVVGGVRPGVGDGGGNNVIGARGGQHTGVPEGRGGERIWSGNLKASSGNGHVSHSMVGIRCLLPTRETISDTSGWPRELRCDQSQLKSYNDVIEEVRSPTSQWYVRFYAVDGNGNETTDSELKKIVEVIEEKKLSFAIRCDEPDGTPGTLYLMGMKLPQHGPSLLGVFKPDPPPAPSSPPAELGDDFYMIMNSVKQ